MRPKFRITARKRYIERVAGDEMLGTTVIVKQEYDPSGRHYLYVHTLHWQVFQVFSKDGFEKWSVKPEFACALRNAGFDPKEKFFHPGTIEVSCANYADIDEVTKELTLTVNKYLDSLSENPNEQAS